MLNQFQAGGGRLASAKAAVLKAKADRDKAEADVRAVKARRGRRHGRTPGASEAMLGYAKIRAPYDGVVTMRKVEHRRLRAAGRAARATGCSWWPGSTRSASSSPSPRRTPIWSRRKPR